MKNFKIEDIKNLKKIKANKELRNFVNILAKEYSLSKRLSLYKMFTYSFASLSLIFVLSFIFLNNQTDFVKSAVSNTPIVVCLSELANIKDESMISFVRLTLPKDTYFYTGKILETKELWLAYTKPLPFVIKAVKPGLKKISLGFYTESGELIDSKVISINFIKQEENNNV